MSEDEVNTLVTAYAKAINLPAGEDHRHCIYCTIIVGVAIKTKDGFEWELCLETKDGPVCEHCAADLNSEHQVAVGATLRDRRLMVAKQGRESHHVTSIARKRRDIEIVHLKGLGWSQTQIGRKVGMSGSGVGTALIRIRKNARS